MTEPRPAFRVLPEVRRWALDRLQAQGYRGGLIVAGFGPQRPEWFGPYDPEDRVALVEPMPCRPCFDACIYNEPICMLGVSPDRVSREVRDVMTRLGRPRAEVFREQLG